MEILDWIVKWRNSYCDGDWEHEHKFTIEGTSNPGWYVTIDLGRTKLESIEVSRVSNLLSDNDWYIYQIKDSQFKASGDINKLKTLLETFKEIHDNYHTKSD